MDYSATIHLPQTDFPMKANLPKKEPEILTSWDEVGLYNLLQGRNAGRPKFILHDGPPYANGDIHLGHSLNKVLKDFIVRFRSMAGYDSPYVPGWDTHGLPIEQQAIKEMKLDRRDVDVVEFRQRCRDYALKYVAIQSKEFQRLGVLGDWNNPYLTLDPAYEAAQIGLFGAMVEKGFIYKGKKPVYWCVDCETALAEAEVEYAIQRAPSIYVKFPLDDSKGLFPGEVRLVIWTTTPWTLPANVAVAVHPDFEYVLVESQGELLLMARELYASALEHCGRQPGRVLESFAGRQLEGMVARNPLLDRASLLILGEHVTLEQGTGLVHTAPGHGLEDFEVGSRYNLPVISPLDNHGRFTSEAPAWEGMTTDEANRAIVKRLEDEGSLLGLEFIQHQYPHCWRCKKPVLFRATEQWFASIDGFREAALEAIEGVHWIPQWGENRIHAMIAERSDWCISRQRTWGVPIPIFYCDSCGETVVNGDTIAHLQRIFREEGSDTWFARDAMELIPPGLTCGKCGHDHFQKESDIMDVWFDSGSSHAAVLEKRPELAWPADVYLEGNDQYRGWFNSSLSTAVAVYGQAPYRTVITHGFLVDEKGRKMSKSLKNGVDPLEVIDKMGADVLRLWVAAADYRRDVAVSNGIMIQMSEAYRKIRNTCRFILGNLYDYDPVQDIVPVEQRPEIDRWALSRLGRLVERVTESYEEYEFHQVYNSLHRFCVLELSSFYLDVLKDRLYCAPSHERRAAQATIHEILDILVRMLNPILPFTCEEVWRHLPGTGRPVSVQLAEWPRTGSVYRDNALEAEWEHVLQVREAVVKALEEARQDKVLGNSLEGEVELFPGDNLYRVLAPRKTLLADYFIVSGIILHKPNEKVPEGAYEARGEGWKLGILVKRTGGEKCPRCWRYTSEPAPSPHQGLCRRCADVVQPDR